MLPLELTLAILKPHIIKNPTALKSIQNIIITSNFKIVKSKTHWLTKEDAETFYDEHKSKFFYNRLVTFMSSGPSDMYILARQDAIQEWRKLIGPTKVFRAQFEHPDTIRGMFGLSDTRNAAHGSDSEESAKREIKLFFPNFDIDKWYQEEELHFRKGKVQLDTTNFLHTVI